MRRPLPVLARLAHAVEGEPAAVGLETQGGHVSAVGDVGPHRAGAGPEVRLVALAVRGVLAAVVLAVLHDAPAIRAVRARLATPGPEAGLVADPVIGERAAVIAAIAEGRRRFRLSEHPADRLAGETLLGDCARNRDQARPRHGERRDP